MSKEQSVTLLRQNKRAMVAALQANGYEVDETMRAADFPKYARWGSGLLDLCVCAVRKSDGTIKYFTVSDWEALTANNKALYLIKGLRVRAYGECFVIAPTNYTSQTRQDALTLAEKYKAHTEAKDGVEDTFTWTMLTRNQAWMLYRLRNQIDSAWEKVSASAKLTSSEHWTTTRYSSTEYWYVNVGTGYYYTASESNAKTFRPISNQPKTL